MAGSHLKGPLPFQTLIDKPVAPRNPFSAYWKFLSATPDTSLLLTKLKPASRNNKLPASLRARKKPFAFGSGMFKCPGNRSPCRNCTPHLEYLALVVCF